MNLENFCLWFSANVLEALPTRGVESDEGEPWKGGFSGGLPDGEAGAPGALRQLRGGFGGARGRWDPQRWVGGTGQWKWLLWALSAQMQLCALHEFSSDC